MAVASDGKIVLAIPGYDNITASRFTVARYRSNGSLDTGFGTRGISAGPIGSAFAVTVLSNGQVLAGGTIAGGLALVRYEG